MCIEDMLTEDDKTQIFAELAKAGGRAQAAGTEALKVVLRRHGWVSDEHLCEAAGLLGLSPAELDSVATAYNLLRRRPAGRHVILLCDSVSCWVIGYTTVLEHLRRRLGIDLGQTTPDGRFTLLPNACLGLCEQAPAMLVDGNVHGNLTANGVDEALGLYP